MSLILEALKKSEAQRRLGEMPNLGTPVTATRRRRKPLPWLAAAVVLVLAAAGGWRYLRPPAPQAPTPPIENRTPPITVTQADGAAHSPPPAQRSAPKPVASTPPASVASAAPSAAKNETAPAPAATVAPRPIPPSVAIPAAPASPPAPVSVPAPAVAVPAPAPASAPAANDVPALNDLPSDLRNALPALPITMQVYSPDPKRRFVIIDGTRVVEGESVRGVSVQEIRPNGLVLEFQGHRLLLPRPGS